MGHSALRWMGAAVVLGVVIVGGFFAWWLLLPGEEETILRVALPSFGPEALDPSMDSQAGLQYHGHMFDHLLGATPDGKLSTQVGALERWEISPDAKTYTLTLRKGMTWHDGVEVTSADLEFSMAYYSREAATCGGCAALKSALDQIELVDRYIVKLNLKEPDVVFMHNLGPVEGDMPLLPKHYWEKVGDTGLAENPLGSGPWKFAERSLGQFIEYEANTDYWNPERVPGFDRLRLIQVPDAAKRVAMLRSGEVDMSILMPSDVGPLKEDGFIIQGPRYVTPTTLRFFMSYDSAYLTSRLEFRKALVLAMDMQSIVEAVYPSEVASLATGSPMFSPVTDGYDPVLPSYPYDPDKAKVVLQEAGYNGETIYLFSLAAYGLREMLQLNGLIAEEWRQARVGVRIIPTDFLPVLARYVARPQQFEDVAPAPPVSWSLPKQA